MTPERRRQIEELFVAALDETVGRRDGFLAAACGDDTALRAEVDAMLASHARTGGLLDRPVAALAGSLADPDPADRHIGPYRVLRELGRGGMGVVYLAERDDGQFRRRVAIKLVRSAHDDGQIQRRFLAERQILASLGHPNIAQLIDGGVTDGQVPYLVMEYVEGLPITTYCLHHGLDIEDRLRLFQQACAAVQHAHQNLVIHRDLKPSNMVVDPHGGVKLLDFGIAKLLNPTFGPADAPLTRLEQWVMTPDYASPEQVRAEPLTTASDVYSLGVILYEVLTGHRPYQLTTRTPAEIVELVCTRDPERPSARAARDASDERLARDLRGDLDAIVMMALRKEPGRRYGSAEALSNDIKRHLDGLPVAARQGSRRYRVGTFLRRHRVEAAAAAAVALSLVTGTVVAVRQAAVAVAERERAEEARAQAESVTGFLIELFQSGETDPARAASDVTARDLLRRGVVRAAALSDQPAVQARMLDVVGLMQHRLGEFDEAERALERAVAIHRKLQQPEALARSLIRLSWVHRSRGEIDRARTLVTEALALRRAVLPPDHADIAEGVYELGFVAAKNEELGRRYREALGILQRTGKMPEQQLRLLQGLATSLRRQGRMAEAVSSDREALALAEREFGPDDFRTGNAMIHLADQVRDIEGDLQTAERLYRRGLELVRREVGETHLYAIHPLSGLATIHSRRGDHLEAVRLLREVVDIRRKVVGDRHPYVALSMGNVAVALERQGRLDEAETIAREALEILRDLGGPRHPDGAALMSALAHIVASRGRYAEADALYTEAIAARTPDSEAGAIDQAEARRAYGRVLVGQRRFAEAEAQLTRSLELLASIYSDGDHPNILESKRALMALYDAWGKPELATRYLAPPGEYVSY